MTFIPWLVILPALPTWFLVRWVFAMIHHGLER